MKFKNFISQDWKVIEFNYSSPPFPTPEINFRTVKLVPCERVNGTPKRTNYQPGENFSGVV